MTISTSNQDYYLVLGVDRHATVSDIKSRFRILAKQIHPDKSECPDAGETFRRCREAYNTLVDPEKRRRYDGLLKSTAAPANGLQKTAPSSQPDTQGGVMFQPRETLDLAGALESLPSMNIASLRAICAKWAVKLPPAGSLTDKDELMQLLRSSIESELDRRVAGSAWAKLTKTDLIHWLWTRRNIDMRLAKDCDSVPKTALIRVCSEQTRQEASKTDTAFQSNPGQGSQNHQYASKASDSARPECINHGSRESGAQEATSQASVKTEEPGSTTTATPPSSQNGKSFSSLPKNNKVDTEVSGDASAKKRRQSLSQIPRPQKKRSKPKAEMSGPWTRNSLERPDIFGAGLEIPGLAGPTLVDVSVSLGKRCPMSTPTPTRLRKDRTGIAKPKLKEDVMSFCTTASGRGHKRPCEEAELQTPSKMEKKVRDLLAKSSDESSSGSDSSWSSSSSGSSSPGVARELPQGFFQDVMSRAGAALSPVSRNRAETEATAALAASACQQLAALRGQLERADKRAEALALITQLESLNPTAAILRTTGIGRELNKPDWSEHRVLGKRVKALIDRWWNAVKICQSSQGLTQDVASQRVKIKVK